MLQALVALASRGVPALRQRLRFRFRAAVLGKATTVVQFLAIAAILFEHWAQVPPAVMTSGLGLAAASLYVGRARVAGGIGSDEAAGRHV